MLDRFFEKMRAFLNGKWASAVYTVLACLTVSFSIENYAIPLFILWVLFVLLVDKSFLNVFLPVTLLCGFAIRTSGQATYLLNHLWLAIPVVIVIFVHFILYGKRRHLHFLWQHLAVSAALILGGLFHISASDYFKPDALYYVFFLGIGMLFFYVWFRSGVSSNEYYDVKEKLMECFLFLGVFCAYSILDEALRVFLAIGSPFAPYVWSNDICELMLFCIPAAFYYARKRYAYLFLGVLFYAAMVFTQSYSAMLSGGILLVLCFAYLLKYRASLRIYTAAILGFFVVVAFSFFAYFVKMKGGLFVAFEAEENGRINLIREAWKNFISAPLFGVGIGDPGAGNATFMTVNWTHNIIFQVLGSLGLVGALAYGYQLYSRIKTVFLRPDAFRLAAGLSYLGLFLISMLQPGEFCPMPYAMMAVMIFTVLEVTDEETREKTKNDEKTGTAS
ncbi:MAG: O-antigen ligase family protein [Ruminococcaceae bacterium]|nr:O-antigen ligase family protein [Oscillospiraceae bacterium]